MGIFRIGMAERIICDEFELSFNEGQAIYNFNVDVGAGAFVLIGGQPLKTLLACIPNIVSYL